MGKLAEAIAALEESVKDSRSLRAIVERLDVEISMRLEDIEGIGAEIMDLASDLDNQLAECDYFAVQRAAESLPGLACWERVLPAIDSIVLLTAIRDEMPAPDLTLPSAEGSAGEGVDHEHPVLTQQDLDRQLAADVANAEQQWQQIWGKHDWDDATEREAHFSDARYEAEQEAVKTRTRRAGQHIMDLFEYVSETWGALTEAAEAARRDDAIEALKAACAAARQAEPAYKLYEVALSQQYTLAPSSLGAMGEFLGGAEAWLKSQRDA
ncbi:hypothetical protein AB5J72_38005 [Streptomyces sp. CG1]|uniref:hypothetical protein n=1 Tax=Streptomyces sp. CG1 TaxID=1287523 RepID=UPI0034E2D0C1